MANDEKKLEEVLGAMMPAHVRREDEREKLRAATLQEAEDLKRRARELEAKVAPLLQLPYAFTVQGSSRRVLDTLTERLSALTETFAGDAFFPLVSSALLTAKAQAEQAIHPRMYVADHALVLSFSVRDTATMITFSTRRVTLPPGMGSVEEMEDYERRQLAEAQVPRTPYPPLPPEREGVEWDPLAMRYVQKGPLSGPAIANVPVGA
jgi:hypothetical protein